MFTEFATEELTALRNMLNRHITVIESVIIGNVHFAACYTIPADDKDATIDETLVLGQLRREYKLLSREIAIEIRKR